MLSVINLELDSDIVKHKRLDTKEYLFRQGQTYEGLFVLKSGWMMLTRVDDNGKRQVLKVVLPGDVLGFQPDTDSPAIYSAIAVQECTICVIPSAVHLCATHPRLAMRLAWISACNMLLLEMYLVQISQHSASNRIAFLVLEIFRRLNLRGLNNGDTIPFPLKQKDIADMVGLTTVHVNRTLHLLKDKGLFAITHHQLTILNYEALTEFVGSEFDMFMACEVPQ